MNVLNMFYGEKRFLSFLGNYDVCMAIESPRDDNSSTITGKWCPLNFEFNNIQVDLTKILLQNMFKRKTTEEFLDEFKRNDTSIEFFKLLPEYKSNGMFSNNYVLCIPNTCDPIQLSHVINQGNRK